MATNADTVLQQSTGGQFTAVAAAGATGAVVISAVPGRLCRIVVTTLGTVATIIYDHASAASGTALFTIPDNATFKYVVMPMRIYDGPGQSPQANPRWIKFHCGFGHSSV